MRACLCMCVCVCMRVCAVCANRLHVHSFHAVLFYINTTFYNLFPMLVATVPLLSHATAIAAL